MVLKEPAQKEFQTITSSSQFEKETVQMSIAELCVLIMSHKCFRLNLHPVITWMSRNPSLKTGRISKVLSDSRIWTPNHLVCKQTVNHLAKWLSIHLQTKWLWVRILLQSLKLTPLRNSGQLCPIKWSHISFPTCSLIKLVTINMTCTCMESY